MRVSSCHNIVCSREQVKHTLLEKILRCAEVKLDESAHWSVEKPSIHISLKKMRKSHVGERLCLGRVQVKVPQENGFDLYEISGEDADSCIRETYSPKSHKGGSEIIVVASDTCQLKEIHLRYGSDLEPIASETLEEEKWPVSASMDSSEFYELLRRCT